MATKDQKQALQAMKENKDFNLETSNGHIYHICGILSKLENGQQFIAIKGRWVPV